jgi:hypothetical protein
MQSVEKKIVNRIRGHGRGWAFSPKDFIDVGSRSSIDTSLHRLVKKGSIRRAVRGIYDYPPYSKRLDRELTPQIDQVAQALARKFKWDIQPSGPAALNILGLSSQVPAEYIYLSDGPDRTYKIADTQLLFRHIAGKESRFALRESRVIVQALKSLGEKRVTTQVVKALREWLDADLCQRILKDTRTVTGWIYEVIREVCGGARG